MDTPPGLNPVENPESTQPGKNGGTLKRGGTNPGSGRPPDEFKAAMRALADREDILAYTERCLKGEFGPKFHMQALAHVTDRGYGKAAQPITGEDGGAIRADVTLRLVRATKADGDG